MAAAHSALGAVLVLVVGFVVYLNNHAVLEALQAEPNPAFTLSVVTNRDAKTKSAVVRRKSPGEDAPTDLDVGLSWPDHLYSLAHIALPFPADDSLYGGKPTPEGSGLHLGSLALRGERGVLRISASDMLRQRWNPFYPYLEKRVLDFMGLADRGSE